MTAFGKGFDDLRAADDYSQTQTKGAWAKANGWDDETKSYLEREEETRVIQVEGYSGSRLG